MKTTNFVVFNDMSVSNREIQIQLSNCHTLSEDILLLLHHNFGTKTSPIYFNNTTCYFIIPKEIASYQGSLMIQAIENGTILFEGTL